MDEEQERPGDELVAPNLGVQIDCVRKIRPQNDPDYPGHTFDFVAHRNDGTSLAIEVTNAWAEDWLRAQGTMMKLADRLTPKLAAEGCAPGHYGLQTVGPHNAPASLGGIARAARAGLADRQAAWWRELQLCLVADGVSFETPCLVQPLGGLPVRGRTQTCRAGR